MEQEEQVHRFPPHCRRPKPRKLPHTAMFSPHVGDRARAGKLGTGTRSAFPLRTITRESSSVEVEDTAGQQGKCFVTLQQLRSPRGGTPATSQELNAIRVYTFQSPVISLSPVPFITENTGSREGQELESGASQAPFAVVNSFLFHF